MADTYMAQREKLGQYFKKPGRQGVHIFFLSPYFLNFQAQRNGIAAARVHRQGIGNHAFLPDPLHLYLFGSPGCSHRLRTSSSHDAKAAAMKAFQSASTDYTPQKLDTATRPTMPQYTITSSTIQ